MWTHSWVASNGRGVKVGSHACDYSDGRGVKVGWGLVCAHSDG